MTTYTNHSGETIVVYPNGMKIRESLLEQKRMQHSAMQAQRKAELRKQWLLFCEKYNMNPDD